MRSTLSIDMFLVAAALSLASCSGKAKSHAAPATSAPVASSPVTVVPDHVDPSELPDGTESMFGVRLPRGMRIVVYTPDELTAAGQVPPEKLANYVRRQVEVRGVELGAAKTIFNRAHVRGQPPQRLVNIEIFRHPWRADTRMVVSMIPTG